MYPFGCIQSKSNRASGTLKAEKQTAIALGSRFGLRCSSIACA
jgi:hypothetical protein